jgi:integrase
MQHPYDDYGEFPIRATHGRAFALAAGVHPKVVQKRLGHASISITLDTYSHVVPTLHDDAANTVAGLLGGSRWMGW